ncbi:MAG: hypothetical protein IPH12_14560 [Saprospirales bacterium]|nr:hypothetical protein [Saprospirales bacterium]MBK8924003.1 hypothetical protein [Saprospirales bacterium]
MELTVFESKHGTKVVAASNLYQVLHLPAQHYGVQIRKWLKDLYEFRDGIRRPLPLRDFARRPRPGEPVEDYFLTLEFAKQIALRSKSKYKLKYARLLELLTHNGQMDLFQQMPAGGADRSPRQNAIA